MPVFHQCHQPERNRAGRKVESFLFPGQVPSSSRLPNPDFRSLLAHPVQRLAKKFPLSYRMNLTSVPSTEVQFLFFSQKEKHHGATVNGELSQSGHLQPGFQLDTALWNFYLFVLLQTIDTAISSTTTATMVVGGAS